MSVRPIAHYYEKYTKWSCPICEKIADGSPNFSDDMLFKNFSFPEGTERCPICGINLNWSAPRYAYKHSIETEEYTDETTDRNSR